MTTSPETRQKISSGGAYESVFGYSRAVRVGPHLHISGTCAPATHERSDAYTQTRAILDVIGKVLAEARMSEADVVRTVSSVGATKATVTAARAPRKTFR